MQRLIIGINVIGLRQDCDLLNRRVALEVKTQIFKIQARTVAFTGQNYLSGVLREIILSCFSRNKFQMILHRNRAANDDSCDVGFALFRDLGISVSQRHGIGCAAAVHFAAALRIDVQHRFVQRIYPNRHKSCAYDAEQHTQYQCEIYKLNLYALFYHNSLPLFFV